MTRGSIAAFAAGAGCMLAAAAGAAGSSTTPHRDSDAKSNARNLTSQVEVCFTESMDYRKCRSAAVLNQGMGQYRLPIGSHRGEVRVSAARRDSYTIDAWSRSGNHFLIVKKASGVIVRKCTTAGHGGCFNNGRW